MKKKLKSSGSFFVYFFGFRLFSWPLHAATTAITTTSTTATTTDRSRTMNLCYMNPRSIDFDSMRSMIHTLIASLRYALGSPNWAECWYIFFDNTVFQFWKNVFFSLFKLSNLLEKFYSFSSSVEGFKTKQKFKCFYTFRSSLHNVRDLKNTKHYNANVSCWDISININGKKCCFVRYLQVKTI